MLIDEYFFFLEDYEECIEVLEDIIICNFNSLLMEEIYYICWEFLVLRRLIWFLCYVMNVLLWDIINFIVIVDVRIYF